MRNAIQRIGFEVSAEKLRAIEQDWHRRTLGLRLLLLTFFLLPVCGFWIWLNFNMARSGGGIARVILVVFVTLSLPIFIFVCTFKWTYRVLGRKQFYQVLREHGFDLCPNCGYRLSGESGERFLEDDRCPECGTRVAALSSESTIGLQ